MKKYIAYAFMIWFASITMSFADDKATVMANENAAWQSVKDKKPEDFRKVVDKDIQCVYPDGVYDMAKELSSMQTSDLKSFSISNYNSFSDEKDVIVSTYTVSMEGTMNGMDLTGTYNAGTVWKKEGDKWLAIFHTHTKQMTPPPK